jgi:hypothetical protein
MKTHSSTSPSPCCQAKNGLEPDRLAGTLSDEAEQNGHSKCIPIVTGVEEENPRTILDKSVGWPLQNLMKAGPIYPP